MTHTPSTVNDNHQCVPPILQPQLPEFRKLIKRAPSGIGLISGKRMTGSDEWDEIITVAVSTEFVADMVRWGGMDAAMPEEAMRRAAFMNLLARHPDARLRTAAATEQNLTAESVTLLANDASHDVKNNLSLNAQAVGLMSFDQAVAFACEDGQLIENTMESMTQAANNAYHNPLRQKSEAATVEEFERSVAFEKQYEALAEKARKLIEHFYEHPDLSVRQEARILQDRLEKFSDEVPKRRLPFTRRRRSASEFGLDLYGRPQDYVYALVFLEEVEGDLRAAGSTPKLMIPVDGLEGVARDLPINGDTEPFVIRMANHPARAVRSEVARRDALPSDAVKALCADSTYDVRQALLANEDILADLSDKEILNIIKADPGLLSESFGFGCASSRISRLLRETYGDSKDPYILETISCLE